MPRRRRALTLLDVPSAVSTVSGPESCSGLPAGSLALVSSLPGFAAASGLIAAPGLPLQEEKCNASHETINK